MITITVGRPGQGKTVWLVGQILELSKRHEVYTNVHISLPFGDGRIPHIHMIETLDDIVHLRSGKIVLDEVQTYLNSRNWDKLDVRFQLLLQQHRKRGLDIVGATQSIKRADVIFRELVQIFYEIHKIVTFSVFGRAFGFFYMRQYDPDSIESATHSYLPIGWYWMFFADPVCLSVYDTTQEYNLADPVGRREIMEYVNVRRESVERVLVGRRVVEFAPGASGSGEQSAVQNN